MDISKSVKFAAETVSGETVVVEAGGHIGGGCVVNPYVSALQTFEQEGYDIDPTTIREVE